MSIEKFKFQKLVRDNIVANMVAIGNKPVYRVLGTEEYKTELLKKIAEESRELLTVSPDNLLGELVDLQEVIDTLTGLLGTTKEELTAAQSEKNTKAGPFRQRHFVESVEVDEESEWGKYLLMHSRRYPKVK